MQKREVKELLRCGVLSWQQALNAIASTPLGGLHSCTAKRFSCQSSQSAGLDVEQFSMISPGNLTLSFVPGLR